MAVILFFACSNTWAKSETYTNYQWEQGFKASNAYCLFQDSKGYIWIGTENGLMRFNGYEFKTYTTRDGLPDNEILKIAEDGEGRLWLAPYANSICYIKNEKVFNPDNDPLLKALRFDTRPESFQIDCYKTVWIKNGENLTGIRANGQLIKPLGIKKKVKTFWLDDTGRLMIADAEGAIFQWDNTSLISKGKAPSISSHMTWVNRTIWLDLYNQKLYRHKSGPGHELFSDATSLNLFRNVYNTQQFSPATLLVAANNGVYEIDINTGKIKDSFLKGYKVGDILLAKDHSLWAGTIGNGIFRISKTPVKSIKFPGETPSVLYIKSNSESIYGTTRDARLFEADITGEEFVGKIRFSPLDKYDSFNPYIYVLPYNYKRWLTFSNYVTLKPKDLEFWDQLTGIYCKSVVRENVNQVLIACAIGVLRYDINNLQFVDTFLYKKKTMAVSKVNSIIYGGTLEGLMAIEHNRHAYPVLPGLPSLRRHITALCPGKNSMLWCANNKAELIGLRNDSLMALIDIKKGLQCNRISCLQATNDFVWIGTDNGLYAIEQRPPYNIVRHITFASGLGSNQVNTLDIYKKRIWVGTLKGINYFDEDDIFLERGSTEIIINRILNGRELLAPSKERLLLQDKSLTIDFDVVDFSDGGKTLFEYRIDNGTWTFIEGKSLNFSTLHYGEFTLSIRAFSPNWAGSTIFEQVFYNPLPFYRRWWFIVSGGIIIIVALLLSVYAFIRKTRKRDRKWLSIQKNLLLLEQTALQGQMNPHFIFNCIAAIKQFYSSGDIIRANNFVHSFSSLIRQTFEMGTETFLSLDKELNYLDQYLSIEKERFSSSFDYQIDYQIQLPDNKIYVPAMLLQPIVENAIRHGVRHLPKGQGMIRVFVLQKGEMIECTIADNGIGRKRSMMLKERNGPGNVTSSIVSEKRVHILGKLANGKIRMHITDLTNEDGEGCGTKVTIAFTINLKQSLNDESGHSRR